MSGLQIRVKGRYRLEEKLYEGTYGSVYVGRNVQAESDCAIKCESKAQIQKFNLYEGQVLEQLQAGMGIPSLFWYGEHGDFQFLVTELYGNNLEEYLDICGGTFSLKTVLIIADKLLSTLQFVHSKGFVHRDLKPANIVVGRGKKLTQLFLIDFAFASQYVKKVDISVTNDSQAKGEIKQSLNKSVASSSAQSKKSNEETMFGTGNTVSSLSTHEQKNVPFCHVQDVVDPNSFIGTLRFASKNVLSGHRNSRRDDLESLGLMLIYFLKGSLPWFQAKGQDPIQRKTNILKTMNEVLLETLCQDLPEQLLHYMNYCRQLDFQDTPDYGYLKRLLKEKFVKEGYQYDHIYDWLLIPLKRKDTNISNRVPISRFTMKENSSVSMINQYFDFIKERRENPLYRCLDEASKKNQKPVNMSPQPQPAQVNTRTEKPKTSSKISKKGKDDCSIF